MKYVIRYYEIQSDHILATPEYSRSEIVEASSDHSLQKYIESKKDSYGNSFEKKKSFGFDYISHTGAVEVSIYTEPAIKRI